VPLAQLDKRVPKAIPLRHGFVRIAMPIFSPKITSD